MDVAGAPPKAEQARIALEASEEKIENGESLTVITYGMGVHWAINAAKLLTGVTVQNRDTGNAVEVLDLRTLNPLDEEAIYASVKKHGKAIVLTEETITNSFAESLAGRISSNCFRDLDAPVKIIGAINTPAIPLNENLERAMLPSAEKVRVAMEELLNC